LLARATFVAERSFKSIEVILAGVNVPEIVSVSRARQFLKLAIVKIAVAIVIYVDG
jgi:hypothetical protein